MGGGRTPYCLPTVGLIVPVFGLALAPYWRSAGCRARHWARALGAALDRYVKPDYAAGESTSNKFVWRLLNFRELRLAMVGLDGRRAGAALGAGAGQRV